MCSKHQYGEAKSVLRFIENNNSVINQAALDEIFDHPDVKNRKIVTFSVIGAFRKGKSFLLDYCLRYLYANYKSINFPNNPLNNPAKWMGDANVPLQGFSWRSGSNRDTTGIIVWSDVFLHTNYNDEKIAIVVIDTQGLFDTKTSPIENARIFSLGTLISSIQIFNLTGQIQEDQLQYLQFVTEFAKFASVDNLKPFQKLMFLIRDWANDYEYDFGIEGGAGYLREVLKVDSSQTPELQSVRRSVNDSFEEMSCILLPYPGKKVAGQKSKNGESYDGNWREMDEDFKEELETFIENVLNPRNLVIKKINGKEMTGAELKPLIVDYLKLFQSNSLPQPLTIYEATVERQLTSIVDKCYEDYKNLISDEKSFRSVNEVRCFHEVIKLRTLQAYKNKNKMGNAQHARKFEEILKLKIQEHFEMWETKTVETVQRRLIHEELLKSESDRMLRELEALSRQQERQLEISRRRRQERDEISFENAVVNIAQGIGEVFVGVVDFFKRL